MPVVVAASVEELWHRWCECPQEQLPQDHPSNNEQQQEPADADNAVIESLDPYLAAQQFQLYDSNAPKEDIDEGISHPLEVIDVEHLSKAESDDAIPYLSKNITLEESSGDEHFQITSGKALIKHSRIYTSATLESIWQAFWEILQQLRSTAKEEEISWLADEETIHKIPPTSRNDRATSTYSRKTMSCLAPLQRRVFGQPWSSHASFLDPYMRRLLLTTTQKTTIARSRRLRLQLVK